MPRVTFPVAKDRAQVALTARGLVAETIPLSSCQNATAPGATGANASAQFGLVGLRAGDVITGLICHCVATGSGSTLTKLGLFDSSGTFLKATADFTASLGSNTFVTAALVGGAYTVPSDGGYYLGLLALATVTVPTFLRGLSSTSSSVSLNSGARAFAAVASQTDLSANVTPANANVAFWVGAY